MKIGLTSDYFYPKTGGAEQSALELAKAIVNKGHKVVVFTRGDGGEDVYEGITIKRIFKHLKKYTIKNDILFPRITDKKEYKRLKSSVKNNDFDILHSNNRDTAVFTAEVGDALDIPVVTHIRDYWPICPKRDLYKNSRICTEQKNCAYCMAKYYDKWINFPFYFKSSKDTEYRRKKVNELSDLFIYNSHYMKNKNELMPGEVVYNPIDIDKIKKRDKESGKVLFIGNVTRRKGAHLLSNIIEGLDVKLHLIGDGYLLPDIKGNNIIKHGRMEYEEVLAHLSTSEILLVPSLWAEPFGRVAVEGMASGNTVLVSDKGGLPEVVNKAGVVIKNQEVKNWRDELKRIIDDDTKRKKLSKKGVERSRKFHPSKIANEMISIYEKLL